jgi:DNA polymerase III epsilon subunit-like protein
MDIIFLDTETTGMDPDARIVELAFKNARTGYAVNEFFKPPVPISFGAMATHHITPDMVAEKPSFEESPVRRELEELLRDNILVAHNASYDIRILRNEGVRTDRYIDTLRLARHLVKSESYAIQYLRYALGLNISGSAHSALGDVNVLEGLFVHLQSELISKFGPFADEEGNAKMMELTKTPIVLETIAFGKYRGRPFSDIATVDRGYLDWLYNSEYQKGENERNEDLLHTIETVFKARR